METGKPNVLDDGLGRDLMNAGRFCFSCEQIFVNRKCLEEHFCSAASHICSCGTEFVEYKDMLEHSSTHEPGHQVLDHETIKKRRIEKRIEEEQQLKRIQTGEVVWKAPRLDNVPSISLTGSPAMQIPMQSAQISQVPQMHRSVSKASLHPNSREKDMQNIFSGVGAPTVDLWTLYQPVVLLQTMQKFGKTKAYICGKCGQCFATRALLISHHSSHVTDKVAGCIGCGLLLSSKKMVPRYHVCKGPNTLTSKFRIITARPLGVKMAQEARTDRHPSVQGVTSQLQLKSQSSCAASKGSRAPLISTMQLENQKFGTYNKSNRGIRIPASLQAGGHNKVSASFKSSQRLPIFPSVQLKTPIQSASSALSKPRQTSSPSNGFPCRVCHLPFETAQLLQRHKCAKAQEFMAKHVQGGKRHYKLTRAPAVSLNLAQVNGERNLGVPASGHMKKNQVMAVGLDKGKEVVPVNGGVNLDDDDDDCYIVESEPDKPAEMIYQVTSSVPIKT